MKRYMSNPVTNAVCLSVFTLFYSIVFILTVHSDRFTEQLESSQNSGTDFWGVWNRFLINGHHIYIVYAMIAATILVVSLLTLRRRAYDEYHTSILTHCLIVSLVLSLMTIAIFYLMILFDPSGIVEKFTLFVSINWITVVLADLSYILICRWG